MKVAYIRVSTEEQNTARQEIEMKDVEKTFIEKISGKNLGDSWVYIPSSFESFIS